MGAGWRAGQVASEQAVRGTVMGGTAPIREANRLVTGSGLAPAQTPIEQFGCGGNQGFPFCEVESGVGGNGVEARSGVSKWEAHATVLQVFFLKAMLLNI